MTLIARIVPDKDNSGERLILAPRRAPLTLPTTEQEAPYHRRYDYTKLRELGMALGWARDAVMLANGCPGTPHNADYLARREQMVDEALARLREVLGDA